MTTPPVNSDSSGSRESSLSIKRRSSQQAAVSSMFNQTMEKQKATQSAKEAATPAAQETAKRTRFAEIAFNEFEKQMNPAKDATRSLINGSQEREIEKVDKGRGPENFCKPAVVDYIVRGQTLSGDVPINYEAAKRQQPAVSDGGKTGVTTIRNNELLKNTVFGQFQTHLEKRGGFNNPSSATNVILGAASQAQFANMQIVSTQQYTDKFQIIPAIQELEPRSVHITSKNVIVSIAYKVGPSSKDSRSPPMNDAEREAYWKEHPEKTWTVTCDIIIPIAELNKPENVYGSPNCNIQFKCNLNINEGKKAKTTAQKIASFFHRNRP